MKVVVCIRQSANGEINPFDASGFETALRLKDAEITVLSMGPEKTKVFLEGLTRLGAKRAVLLCDKVFAGADTLATAYTLSLAVKKLNPDLVICGRQSVDGDTGQVGPSLAYSLDFNFIANVMSVSENDGILFCKTRQGEETPVKMPALITVERSCTLRLPSIRSKIVQAEVMTAAELDADLQRCGLAGSPTRVVKTYRNDRDRRNCKFIKPSDFAAVIEEGLKKSIKRTSFTESGKKLKNVMIIGESPREMAQTVAVNITFEPMGSALVIAERINLLKPDAVIWGSDSVSKAVAPQVASILKTGLCADCTSLESDGKILYMYRPACSGDIIAKIRCITNPPMATVRTPEEKTQRIIIGIGYGAKNDIDAIKAFAEKYSAGIAASRKMVDNDFLPYEYQVGLTGKSVNPDVYIAAGISGAVHHIAGIRQSGTIIAINSDRDAPVFNYADYGIVGEISRIL